MRAKFFHKGLSIVFSGVILFSLLSSYALAADAISPVIKEVNCSSDYEGSGETLVSIAPENYEGKIYNDPSSNQQTGLINGLGPESYIENAQNSGIIRPEEAGYDYLYSGIGDATSAIKIRSYIVSYAKDADGNPILDGEPGKYKLNYTLTGGNADGFDKSASQVALKNVENGQYYYAYCIDSDTETVPGAWYKVSNIDECDYFPSEDSKNHLRAIVNNGYWGTESGTGSVKKIVESMKAYYGDAQFTAIVDDKNNTATFKVSDIISSLTEAEALAVTQAAIWSYSNGALSVQDGKEGRLVKDIVPVYQPRLNDARPSSRFYRKGTYGSDTVDQATKESNARIQAMYQWLLSLIEEKGDETTVINENNFLTQDGVKIEVGSKAGSKYNVDLTFAIVAEAGEGDDLIVKLIDAQGNVIRKARLAGDDSSDGEDFSTLIKNEDNSYTFKDVPMSANRELTFDLKLEGTQNLKRGVYVYTSPNTDDSNTFQTLVGIAEGAQRVGVYASLSFSFEADTPPPPSYDDEPPVMEVPKTGDMSNAIWGILLILLGACSAFILKIKNSAA